MSCGGSYNFEEAQKIGYINPNLSKEEWEKRKKNYGYNTGYAEVKIDKHGLIWSDNLVLVNLFQCSHLVRRVNKWVKSEEYREYVQTTNGTK
jgi:hypothetical protein